MGEGRARGRALAAQPALHVDLGDRTRARSCSPPPVDQSRLPLEIGLHPQRSPGRMRRAHRKTAVADLIANRVQMIERRPRAIEQTLDPHLLITRKPLVARFSVHTELPGRSLQLVPLASRAATTKRIRSSTAQVSLYPIGNALLADHSTCHPCRRSILSIDVAD